VIALRTLPAPRRKAQEEVGTQVAVQIRDYLPKGLFACGELAGAFRDQYRRVRPYLELAERLGSLVSQASQTRPGRIRSAMRAKLPKSARTCCAARCLPGVLNAVLDEKVNVVNAPAVAAARGLTVEEETRRRETLVSQ